MNTDEYIESEINDTESIIKFISTIKDHDREMVLTSDGNTVAAILTGEQYSWFLDQLDLHQNTSFIKERAEDREGSQTLDDLKREIK